MTRRDISLVAGAFFIAVPLLLPAPEGLPDTAWRASGLALTMALWWLTEALPLAATALLPLALAPLLGLAPLSEVATSYSHPLIILFLGGFLLAKAIERCGLHLRIAYGLLARAGDDPRRVLAAIMTTTAFLSLWVSNTASAMVVAPIAGAIAGSQNETSRFAAALMLGVAFAATIGGMGSLIGTPPNAILAAYLSDTYGLQIGFAEWAMFGMPVALILLAVAWALLARVTPGVPGTPLTTAFGHGLPPMGRAERRVAVLATLTAAAWIVRPALEGAFPGLGLTDAGIAMLAGVALFLLPAGDGSRLLDWGTAAGVRWDVLLLFGGGLALAGILEGSGLADWIGAQSRLLHALPRFALLLAMAAMIVYVGELASNTAMAAIFIPIAGAAAIALESDPVLFVLPVALAASIGFMLPVATPPNAIVFTYPSVTRATMLRAGVWLDLIGIVVAVGLSSLLAPLIFAGWTAP